jgi:hypothetical protein
VQRGTPHACNGCHTERSARWAAERVRAWYGHEPTGYQQYAATLHAARAGTSDAPARLIALLAEHDQPAIARATAAAALGEWPDASSRAAIAGALADADPLVRAAALQALDGFDPEQRWTLASPLLRDSLPVLRALAASALAVLPADRVPRAAQADFDRASAEYIASEIENASPPLLLPSHRTCTRRSHAPVPSKETA